MNFMELPRKAQPKTAEPLLETECRPTALRTSSIILWPSGSQGAALQMPFSFLFVPSRSISQRCFSSSVGPFVWLTSKSRGASKGKLFGKGFYASESQKTSKQPIIVDKRTNLAKSAVFGGVLLTHGRFSSSNATFRRPRRFRPPRCNVPRSGFRSCLRTGGRSSRS